MFMMMECKFLVPFSPPSSRGASDPDLPALPLASLLGSSLLTLSARCAPEVHTHIPPRPIVVHDPYSHACLPKEHFFKPVVPSVGPGRVHRQLGSVGDTATVTDRMAL